MNTGANTMPKKICLLSLLYSIFLFPAVLMAAEHVQVVAESARSISFKVDVPEPVFVLAGDTHGSACSIEGFSLYNESGMPGVVQRGVMVAIPPGSSVDINVAVHSSQDFKNIDLAPVPTLNSDGPIKRDDDSFSFVKDLNVYRSNEYFPAQFAEVANTGELRGMHFAQVRITPVQYNPVQRIVRVVRSMTVTLTFDGFEKTADRPSNPPERLSSPAGSVFDAIRTRSIINPDSGFVDAGRAQVSALAQAQISGELQDSPFAIKIVTSSPGIHRVRYEDISGLGVDLAGLTNSNLKIENLGHEIAVYRSGTGQFKSGDYILFYAEDFQSQYSSTNVYWLYQGTSAGLTMQTAVSTPESGFPQPASFNTVEHFEQNLAWRRNLPDYVDGEDDWFWRLLNVFGVKTHTITFTLKDFAIDAGSFDIAMYLRGLTAFNHRTKVSLNGTQIADFDWTGAAIDRRTFSGISPALFNEGVNTLTVEALSAPGNEPSTPDQYYLNRAELTYARRYVADASRLAFGADTSGGTTFEVSGFGDTDIMVFDVSSPAAPLQLTGTHVSTSDGTARVRFESSVGSASRFYAVTTGASLAPKALFADSPSNLMSPRTDIDYIIIAHGQFLSALEALKTIREQAGLRVEIVDVQDIYDEFSYGIKDVTAVKDFLRYAYNNWHAADHPTYVVLVGDATYDYRDNLGRAADGKADLVPTYLGYRGSLGSSVGATASDNWFVCVDGDDPLPDMVIGRLCVKTIQDLQNIIDKIETYENTLPDEWQSRVLFAADSDDQNIFEYLAESLIRILPAAYTDLSLYLRLYGSDIATATEDLIDAISNGALITNYIGHGSTDTWSKSTWLQTPNQNTGITRDDVSLLTNTDKYTFLMILNCLSGTFSEVTDDYCMAEEFMRQQQLGAVFCVAPSASGLPSHHSVLGQSMYENLFNANITVGGALLTESKIEAYQQTSSRDILETFNFFGDPALELKVPAKPPEEFLPLEPSDGAELPIDVIRDFRWNSGPYTMFKIEFSTTETFDPRATFSLPRKKKRFIREDSYLPTKGQWRKLIRKSGMSGVLYWRVVAYDETDRSILDYTKGKRLMFYKP